MGAFVLFHNAAIPTGVACQLKQSVVPNAGSLRESSSSVLIAKEGVAMLYSFEIPASVCNQLRDFLM